MQLHSNLLFNVKYPTPKCSPQGNVRLSLLHLDLLEAEKVGLVPLIEVCKPLFHANPQTIDSSGNEFHTTSPCHDRFFLLYNVLNSFARVKTVRTRIGAKRIKLHLVMIQLKDYVWHCAVGFCKAGLLNKCRLYCGNKVFVYW